MIRLWSGGARKRLVASITMALLTLVAIWLSFHGFPLEPSRDYEECVEALKASPSVNEERGGSMADCNARFAGRRKAGGGYTYYDFMQGRNFDIVGPNPTAQEREKIDREYMGFLDTLRRETISAELAKRQNEQLRADLERQQEQVGRPLLLMPRSTSSAVAKRPADRSKSARCEESALACGWSKLSTVVKNAFASSLRGKP
jgi:hypothetical protein